ncbi:hypothetical protein IGI04_010845 [Brassica rapa subsp. trilocularis]|uniref:Uncharacterized protein n=1 Tax=Brassica rapa subsp. trilocularis TaxID=1813537 RepID=A0ABQ7N3K9_BRACM|nr:hypothetical protein IGI04_010845 [Brassica rapa subsp. trilocularis]
MVMFGLIQLLTMSFITKHRLCKLLQRMCQQRKQSMLLQGTKLGNTLEIRINGKVRHPFSIIESRSISIGIEQYPISGDDELLGTHVFKESTCFRQHHPLFAESTNDVPHPIKQCPSFFFFVVVKKNPQKNVPSNWVHYESLA